MKRQEIEKVERLLGAAFRSQPESRLDDAWQSGVMGAVRRHHAAGIAEKDGAISSLMSLKLMWRLSMCSIVAALLCFAFYMMTPSQTASSNGIADLVPLDSFENAVTVVALL